MKTCSFYCVQYAGNMDKNHCANEVTAAAHFTLSLSLTLVQKKEDGEKMFHRIPRYGLCRNKLQTYTEIPSFGLVFDRHKMLNSKILF